MAVSAWWHPAVPMGAHRFPVAPVGAHQSPVMPSDACQRPMAPAGACWPCAHPMPPCPSPAVTAGPLALIPTVAAHQSPDEEPEQAEEQQRAQDGARDDARLPSSCSRSTACHRRPPCRLPTGHHAPGGTLARRASPQQHPACTVVPSPPVVALTWHKVEVDLAHGVADTVGDAALVDTGVHLCQATD